MLLGIHNSQMSEAHENTKDSGDAVDPPPTHTHDTFALPPSPSPPGLMPANVEDDHSIILPFPDNVNMLVALWPFQAFQPDQLTFNTGDVVEVLDRNADGPGWWKVQRISDDEVGIVPNNYFVCSTQA